MLYARVPGLDASISRLVMGSVLLNTDDLERSFEILDAFVDAGGNCVDTAHNYGAGKSERALGLWMRERGNRERIVVQDKGANSNGGPLRVDPENIDQDITESLERLQTDWIDLYQLHVDNPLAPVGPIVECLHANKVAGRIRAYGGSNWSTERLEEANAYAEKHGLTPFTISSPHLSLAACNLRAWGGCLATSAEDRAWYARHQMPLFAWTSQAGGFFAGGYSPDDLSNGHVVRLFYNEGNWERLRRARDLAKSKGATAHQVALAWVLCQPFPVFALIGPRTLAELEESVPATDLTLTEPEMRWLNLED